MAVTSGDVAARPHVSFQKGQLNRRDHSANSCLQLADRVESWSGSYRHPRIKVPHLKRVFWKGHSLKWLSSQVIVLSSLNRCSEREVYQVQTVENIWFHPDGPSQRSKMGGPKPGAPSAIGAQDESCFIWKLGVILLSPTATFQNFSIAFFCVLLCCHILSSFYILNIPRSVTSLRPSFPTFCL